jgi:hypothetical protein
VFKRKAADQVALLSASPFASSSIGSSMNGGETKPRRGAFEITVEREDGKSFVVWTGLKQGPPRRLKFPDPSVLLAAAKKFLET